MPVSSAHFAKTKHVVLPAVLGSVIGLTATPAKAVEGGIETYLLGSRDSLSGILPPQGTYVANDFISFSGTTESASLGGAAVVDPELSVKMYKLGVTHVFGQTLGSARVGINFNLPYVAGKLDLAGELGSGLSGGISDETTDFGDLTVTPLFGWSSGNVHSLLALQFFLPTGAYSTADIDVAARSAEVLNTGKNRFAFDPTYAVTWMNPDTGLEISGAAGVTFSAKNNATDYQTAPEAHFEGAIMQHLPNALALGLTGYAYHQIGNDSGSGAKAYEDAIGTNNLQAEVYGLGPILTWSTKIGEMPVSIKAKYIKETGARKRFESDKAWVTLGLVF